MNIHEVVMNIHEASICRLNSGMDHLPIIERLSSFRGIATIYMYMYMLGSTCIYIPLYRGVLYSECPLSPLMNIHEKVCHS